jgi:hypothetical protein
MTSKGWRYQPAVNSVPVQNQYGPGTAPLKPTALVEFRKSYGYGYFNHPALPTNYNLADGKAATDGQQEYVATLAADALTRYQRDLGAGPDEIANGAHPGFPSSGCLNSAELSTSKTIPQLPKAILAELSTQGAGTPASQSFQSADREWSTCMQGRGFDFKHSTDAQASISTLWSESQGAAAQSTDAALEIRTGSADAECAIGTVWPAQSKLEWAVVQKVIDQYGRAAVCGTSCF